MRTSASGIGVTPSVSKTRPRRSAPRSSCIAVLSDRSRTVTPSLSATCRLACAILMPFAICIRATRSPAARSPFMPEAHEWATSMPNVSPEPTYNPSRRSMSTQAREARETASIVLVASTAALSPMNISP